MCTWFTTWCFINQFKFYIHCDKFLFLIQKIIFNLPINLFLFIFVDNCSTKIVFLSIFSKVSTCLYLLKDFFRNCSMRITIFLYTKLCLIMARYNLYSAVYVMRSAVRDADIPLLLYTLQWDLHTSSLHLINLSLLLKWGFVDLSFHIFLLLDRCRQDRYVNRFWFDIKDE